MTFKSKIGALQQTIVIKDRTLTETESLKLCCRLQKKTKYKSLRGYKILRRCQWHFQQDNAPVHNSILVAEYLTTMDIKTVPHLEQHGRIK